MVVSARIPLVNIKFVLLQAITVKKGYSSQFIRFELKNSKFDFR